MPATPSLVRGADTPPLLEYTIGAALDLAAAQWPDEIALISPPQSIRWTYAELAARADILVSVSAAICRPLTSAGRILQLSEAPCGTNVQLFSPPAPSRSAWSPSRLPHRSP